MADVPVSELRNLGPRSAEWLAAIGVTTEADLERLGSVEVYRLLKTKGFPVSLNLVWAIEGAIADIDWRELPPELKAELRSVIRKL